MDVHARASTRSSPHKPGFSTPDETHAAASRRGTTTTTARTTPAPTIPMKEESRRIFLDFWQEPSGSPRRDRDGIYASYVFGPPGERVQVILPDLRYNRTAMTPMALQGAKYEAWGRKRGCRGPAAAGTLRAQPRPSATMLGERQWQWLERQLEVPAEVRLFGSSVQVLADRHGLGGAGSTSRATRTACST